MSDKEEKSKSRGFLSVVHPDSPRVFKGNTLHVAPGGKVSTMGILPIAVSLKGEGWSKECEQREVRVRSLI